MARRTLLCALLTLLLARTPQAGSSGGPILEVEAAPSLATAAEKVRRADPAPLEGFLELLGLPEAGPPIRVVLAEEGSPLVAGVPPWVAGFARGGESLVVLVPSRSPTYPDEGLISVLHHEVAHVLLHRAAHGRPVPRWLDEGVAMLAGRSWTLGDDSRLAVSAVLGGRTSLYGIDRLFRGDAAEVRKAYALSGALVSDLVERYGGGLPRALLRRVAEGEDLDTAMRKTVGRSLLEVDADFLARQSLLRRWVPILGSSALLWFAIAVLGLLAARRRRRQELAQRARLEAEDALAGATGEDAAQGEPGVPPEGEGNEEGRANPPLGG